MDVLSQEFMAFADSIKELFALKEQKNKTFKEHYTKHKQEIAEIEKQAEELKKEFFKSDTKDSEQKMITFLTTVGVGSAILSIYDKREHQTFWFCQSVIALFSAYMGVMLVHMYDRLH